MIPAVKQNYIYELKCGYRYLIYNNRALNLPTNWIEHSYPINPMNPCRDMSQIWEGKANKKCTIKAKPLVSQGENHVQMY